jgi:hypothetical protein
MVENCYILYSCDGSYDPIVSNYSGLSAHSSSFVTIETDDPSVSGDTCYYVLDIGVVDCDPTYNVTGATSGCSCQCFCYLIKSVSATTDVTYVNCDNEIVVDTMVDGVTYNICSKVYPQFDNQTPIPIKLTDICVDGQCPSSIPTVKPANECDVITIFPMGVTCSVLQPTSDLTFDGAATLIITGGTPPYTVAWDSGSFAPALTNLGIGEYKATVTDYYNDFTVLTNCILTAETTTFSGICFVVSGLVEDNLTYISTESSGLKNGKPYYKLQNGTTILGYVFWSQAQGLWIFCESLDCQGSFYQSLNNSGYLYPSGDTWNTSGTTSYYIEESYPGNCVLPFIPKTINPLCVTLVVRSTKIGQITDVIQIDLDPSNDINGQPSWSSSTGQYVIYWNTGSTPPQWTMTGYSNPSTILVNNDPASPPISNWQVLGSPDVYSMDVADGNCSSSYVISVNAVVNNSGCNSNTGSITVTANGGTAPYQYSINGGFTYQSSPIFNGLSTGSYSIFAQDANSTIGAFAGNVVVASTLPTTYNLTLNVNYSTGLFTITAPTLPAGVTITFDLVLSSTFSYYPTNLSPLPTYNNIAVITGIGPMTLSSTNSNTYPLGGPCTADGAINVTQQTRTFQNTITMNSNQIINGSISNSISNNPTGSCQDAVGYYQLLITNNAIENCDCCTLNVINTTPPGPVVI